MSSAAGASHPPSSPIHKRRKTGTEGVRIGVVVRSRPLSDSEKKTNTPVVLSCDPRKKEISINSSVKLKNVKKKYVYDRVFGQFATQQEVFEGAVLPIVDEVLQGFNCTVFAYGQTGTGKTFTMTGDLTADSSKAGIIPRSVQEIFNRLDDPTKEYTIKVSCLQIYNEELQDLLDEDSTPSSSKKSLRIFEERSQKGSVSIPDLTEVIVTNTEDIFAVIERSASKRASAATLMNKNSSRSHCIFTVTIHCKETSCDGQQTIRTGKLNLVDLAGSECVGKSGAMEDRAKETGNINKSLLTLGRVINKLVEGEKHIPYRDSKLTRLLQESLGGRAKTVIIATVSPSWDCMEETMNTLEYAHRAKNILNKPEVNETKTQKAFVKEMQSEITDLHAQLEAARNKNGVYLPEEQYRKLMTDVESKTLLLQEHELELNEKKKALKDIEKVLDQKCQELDSSNEKISQLEEELDVSKKTLAELQISLAEQKYISDCFQSNETLLLGEAQDVKKDLVFSMEDCKGFRAVYNHLVSLNTTNKQVSGELENDVISKAVYINKIIGSFVKLQQTKTQEFSTITEQFIFKNNDLFDSTKTAILDNSSKIGEFLRKVTDVLSELQSNVSDQASSTHDIVNSTLVEFTEISRNISDKLLHQQLSFAECQSNFHSRQVELSQSIRDVISHSNSAYSKLCMNLTASFDKLLSAVSDSLMKYSERLEGKRQNISASRMAVKDETLDFFENLKAQMESAFASHRSKLALDLDKIGSDVDEIVSSFHETRNLSTQALELHQEEVNGISTEITESLVNDGKRISRTLSEVDEGVTNNVNEAKLLISDMIASYSSGSADITRTLTNSQDNVRNAMDSLKASLSSKSNNARGAIHLVNRHKDLLCETSSSAFDSYSSEQEKTLQSMATLSKAIDESLSTFQESSMLISNEISTCVQDFNRNKFKTYDNSPAAPGNREIHIKDSFSITPSIEQLKSTFASLYLSKSDPEQENAAPNIADLPVPTSFPESVPTSKGRGSVLSPSRPSDLVKTDSAPPSGK